MGKKKWLIGLVVILVVASAVGLICGQMNGEILGYPRKGIQTRDYKAMIIVSPKAMGERAFLAETTDRDKYPEDQYVATEIHEQKNVLYSLTGYFWGWEGDKKILVKDGWWGQTYKFEISEASVMTVNDFGEQKSLGLLAQLPKEQAAKLFWKGRKMVVKPGFYPPDAIKKEADGAIWATAIIMKGK